MSILGNILGAIMAPKTEVSLSGDASNNDFTGTGLKNDNVCFDATVNRDENFKLANADFSKLDGGLGIDTLTIKLTQSQHAALLSEFRAKVGAIKAGGLDLGEMVSLFKIATGQQYVKFESIGVELKGWECIKFDVCEDPNNNPVALNDEAHVQEDQTVTGNVLTNDKDKDAGQTLTVQKVGSTAVVAGTMIIGEFGSLFINPNGTYNYIANGANAQALGNGLPATETFSYTVVDPKGATNVATLTFNITGTNDVAVISGVNLGEVKEDVAVNGDDNLVASGKLGITDADTGQSHFIAQTVTGGNNFGTFTLDAAGNWTYTADNSQVAIQQLNDGESITDSFTAVSADGTKQIVTVTIIGTDEASECHPELLQNWNFERDQVGADGFVIKSTPDGWTNEKGGSLEVVRADYGNITGYGEGESQWFDTSASPGNTHISQTFDLGTGNHAQLSVSVAAQSLEYLNQHYATDPNAKVQFVFNGEVVREVSMTDFITNGVIDYNKFREFTADVTGQTGNDKFEIVAVGQAGTYTGFAIDHVSLKETGNLFTENFDSYATLDTSNIWSAAAINLGTGGWQNAGFNTEVAVKGYGGVVNSTSGNYWLDTQATVDGGPIDIKHQFSDPTGGQVRISFDIATENFSPAYVTADDASFQVKIDGNIVQTITAQQLRAMNGGADNKMVHFDFVASTGSIGDHTLELVDTSPNASDVGFALDSIKVVDWGKDVAPDCGCDHDQQQGHLDDTALFTENFDHTPTTSIFLNNGQFVSADIDLKAEGWTGTEHTDERGTSAVSEVGVDGVLGGIEATSGNFFLDTQNTKGGINIGHEFTDSTAAVGAKTAVLSFDIGKMNVDWNGSAFATDSNASFEFRIDDVAVKSFTAADLTNELTHFEIDILASDYTGADNVHTLSLVDTSATPGYFGFAVDSIQIHDWIV